MDIFDCHFIEDKNGLFNENIRTTFVKEKIYVDVEINNPLKIALEL